MPRIIKIMTECQQSKNVGIHEQNEYFKYQNSKIKISESLLVKRIDQTGLQAKSTPVSRTSSPQRGFQRQGLHTVMVDDPAAFTKIIQDDIDNEEKYLKFQQFDKVREFISCPICLRTIDAGKFMRLKCQHQYCYSCIEKKRPLNNTCNICQQVTQQYETLAQNQAEPDSVPSNTEHK